MASFFLSLRLWAGTLFATTVLFLLSELYHPDGWIIPISVAILLLGALFSCPLVGVNVLLMKITRALPYAVNSKIYWLISMILAVNFGFLQLLCWLTNMQKAVPRFFILSTIGLLIMVWLSKNDLKKLFTQQTNQQ